MGNKILERFRGRFDPRAEDEAANQARLDRLKDRQAAAGTAFYRDLKAFLHIKIKESRWHPGDPKDAVEAQAIAHAAYSEVLDWIATDVAITTEAFEDG